MLTWLVASTPACLNLGFWAPSHHALAPEGPGPAAQPATEHTAYHSPSGKAGSLRRPQCTPAAGWPKTPGWGLPGCSLAVRKPRQRHTCGRRGRGRLGRGACSQLSTRGFLAACQAARARSASAPRGLQSSPAGHAAGCLAQVLGAASWHRHGAHALHQTSLGHRAVRVALHRAGRAGWDCTRRVGRWAAVRSCRYYPSRGVESVPQTSRSNFRHQSACRAVPKRRAGAVLLLLLSAAWRAAERAPAARHRPPSTPVRRWAAAVLRVPAHRGKVVAGVGNLEDDCEVHRDAAGVLDRHAALASGPTQQGQRKRSGKQAGIASLQQREAQGVPGLCPPRCTQRKAQAAC